MCETDRPLPLIGRAAPIFKGVAVVNGDFKDINLSQYKGKYVVLFFYPMDFTFVCPTEICAFSDMVDQFKNINCEVIAASCDSQYSHLAWTNQPRKQGGLGPVNIPLLADKSGKIAEAYGVLNPVTGISYRGLFIIDAKGTLRSMLVNDLQVGRSVEETLRLVQAFQFVEAHGEVCPIGWKPGEKTIKPNPKDAADYFSTV